MSPRHAAVGKARCLGRRRPSVRPALVAWAGACALLVTTSARADAPIRLSYEVPEAACPEEDWFRAAVASRLGRDPFVADAAATDAFLLSVRVSVVPGRWSGAKVVLSGIDRPARGTREFKAGASECRELLETVALTASLMLEPVARGEDQRREATAPTERTRLVFLPAMTPPKERRLPPAEPDDRRIALRLSVAAVAGFGTAPSVTAGVRAGAGLRYRAASIDAAARLDGPGSTANAAGVGVSSWLRTGEVAPCYHVGVLLGCGVVTLGQLVAEGFGADNPQEHDAFYGAAGLRLGVEVRLSRALRLAASADALVPWSRTTLAVDDAEFWTLPTVAGAMSLGFLLEP